jgi:predicted RNA-binding Zn ribbon-like protein
MLATAQGSLKLLREHPALDLLNSIDTDRGRWVDFLKDAENVVPWCVAAGLLSELAGERLKRRFEADPALAEAVRSDLVALRSLLGKLIIGRPEQALPELINRLLPSPLLRADLQLNVPDDSAERSVLARLALSATELIVGGTREQVRQCEAPSCEWYFIDQTGRRRWCIMQGCGNAAKARRHRARAKEGS